MFLKSFDDFKYDKFDETWSCNVSLKGDFDFKIELSGKKDANDPIHMQGNIVETVRKAGDAYADYYVGEIPRGITSMTVTLDNVRYDIPFLSSESVGLTYLDGNAREFIKNFVGANNISVVLHYNSSKKLCEDYELKDIDNMKKLFAKIIESGYLDICEGTATSANVHINSYETANILPDIISKYDFSNTGDFIETDPISGVWKYKASKVCNTDENSKLSATISMVTYGNISEPLSSPHIVFESDKESFFTSSNEIKVIIGEKKYELAGLEKTPIGLVLPFTQSEIKEIIEMMADYPDVEFAIRFVDGEKKYTFDFVTPEEFHTFALNIGKCSQAMEYPVDKYLETCLDKAFFTDYEKQDMGIFTFKLPKNWNIYSDPEEKMDVFYILDEKEELAAMLLVVKSEKIDCNNIRAAMNLLMGANSADYKLLPFVNAEIMFRKTTDDGLNLNAAFGAYTYFCNLFASEKYQDNSVFSAIVQSISISQ